MMGAPVCFVKNFCSLQKCFCCPVRRAVALPLLENMTPNTKKWLNVSDDLKYFSNFVIVKQCNGRPSVVKIRIGGVMLLFVSVLQNDYLH